jgi:hypothetical protein
MIGYSSHFWNLANTITAFSIAQVVAVLYAVGQYPSLTEGAAKGFKIILGAAVIFTVTYRAAVYFCHRAEVVFLDRNATQLQRDWLWFAMAGRLTAILLFGVLFCAGVWLGTGPARRSSVVT